MPERPTSVGPLEIRNPVILAACPLGGSPETLRAAYDAGAGAVVTKSVTLEPREGSPEPNHMDLDSGWHINWVGLRNPGAVEFARMLGSPDYPVIVSLAGSRPADFGTMVGMFGGVAGFEINASCPNAAGTGDCIGDNPGLTAQAVTAAKRATSLPVFAKIGYGMEDAAVVAIAAGVDGITAINTIPGEYVDAASRRVLAGGLSGHPLLPLALRTIRKISRFNVPVIGCGGISTWEDAALHIDAGATAVQVGTAALSDMSVLGNVAAGLERHGYAA